ncbi:AAA domain-containing protein [Obelidium mucronatum]|nr:AAA domain-containing protein [Obelidium mucronatum]
MSLFSVFSANTNTGKTILSAALCRGASRRLGAENVAYIKPVQTGFPDDSDERFVTDFCKGIHARTLFAYRDPISPHLAAIIENRPLDDQTVLKAIQEEIQSSINKRRCKSKKGFILVETAGGVNSPAASGTLQSDLYKSLQIPSVLIGDSKLGGISTTLCSYESMRLRGYDIPLLLMFNDERYRNHEIIQKFVGAPVVIIPTPPEKPSSSNMEQNLQQDRFNLLQYFESIDSLMAETVDSISK